MKENEPSLPAICVGPCEMLEYRQETINQVEEMIDWFERLRADPPESDPYNLYVLRPLSHSGTVEIF